MVEGRRITAGVFRQALYLLTILILFFAALELVLGLVGVRPQASHEDPLVGFAGNAPLFVARPAPTGTTLMTTAKNKIEFFNEQQFPAHKRDNSYRIFCMGGSTTFGRPYSDSTSFCGWLRAFLPVADPSRNWELINAGGVSYASYRVARLMQELTQYQPDLFIVYSGQNEFLEERSYGDLKRLPYWMLYGDSVLSHTRTYSALKRAIDTLGAPQAADKAPRSELNDEVSEFLTRTIGPSSYARDDTLKQQILTHYGINLGRMVTIARNAGAGIMFVEPVVNLKDMSPFKSTHRAGLGNAERREWDKLYQQGNLRLQAGAAEAALEFYDQAVQLDERYAELHYRRGRALFALGHYQAAEAAFWRAVDEDIAPLRMPSSMPGLIAEVADWHDVPVIDYDQVLRRAYLRRYDHAVFGNEFFLDHVHPNIEGHRLLALQLLQQLIDQGVVTPAPTWNPERITRITAEVIAGLDDRAHAKALVTAGRLMDWAGKFDEAHHLFSKALEKEGPNGFVYGMLGKTAFRNGKPQQAIDYYRKAVAVAPEMGWVQRALGGLLARNGEIDAAIEHYRADLKLDADNYFSHDRIAVLLASRGDAQGAEDHFKQALRSKPDYGPALLNYMVFLGRQERYHEAEALGRQLLETTRDNAVAHNNFGIIMAQQGDFERAIEHFSEALRINPKLREAADNLAQAQAKRASP